MNPNQLLLVGVPGKEVDAGTAERLRRLQPGGFILFGRNIESAPQLRKLVDDLRDLSEVEPVVTIDQEGGRVQRFRDGFTRLPPLACLGVMYDRDRKRALNLAQTAGWLMAAEMRAVGVDISFAPVLDLDYGVSTVIGDRALHKRPEAVADLVESGTAQAARAALRSLNGAFSDAVHELTAELTAIRVYVEAAIDFPEEEIDFLGDAELAERLVSE